MGSSDSTDGQQSLSSKIVGFFYRVSSILTEPHISVQGTRKRQQARMLSILLLLAIVLFIFETITATDATYVSVYNIGSALSLICYIGSRSRYIDYSLNISLAAITTIPPFILLFRSDWQPSNLNEIIVWFFAAMVIGTLLANPRTVLVQGIVVLTLLLISGIGIHGLSLQEIGVAFGTVVIVILLMLVCSYMLEEYIIKEIEKTSEVNRQRWELEVYTQLLRHDLRNDLQAVLNCIELADLTLDINIELTHEHLDTALEIGNSMVRLLGIFSMPMEIPSTDLVSLIEELANRAEKNHPGMSITVNATDDSRKRPFTASRLMPMVWNNIFRNAAQYAGEEPRILIDISIEQNQYAIMVEDDGPGIPENEREWIFKRGKGTASKERGLGLYLANVVIESHNGSIELIDSNSGSGTRFIIRLPAEPIL